MENSQPSQTVQTTTTPENNSGGSVSDGGAQNSQAAQAASGAAPVEQAAKVEAPSLLGDKPAEGAAAKADAKPAEGDKPKADDKAKPEDSKPEPVQLADFTAPEGVKLDPEAAGEFKAIAQELGLKQESAQKIADIGAKLAQKWSADQQSAIKAASEKWASDAKTDKEYGGDAFDQNLAVANKALDTFGSPELKAMLKESGLNNHPEIIRFMLKAGKQISQDKFVPAGRPTQTGKDTASVMYPNHK